ncbi:MAG: efflux RND transporter permease subunit [Gemmataceae bacterium]|nr:efflux RND transporter permease subunit [Gemmataceae bacterium]
MGSQWPCALNPSRVVSMNPIVFAMRHPITVMMLVIALLSGGALALKGMRVDIFPSLNMPRIYVFLQFGGMSPAQMEGLIVNQFELLFQYVDNVETIESSSIQQVALLKIAFFPSTDMGQAMGQVVAMANRAMSRMPPGTLPPMVMRLDAGSLPVGYLVMSSKKTPRGLLADLAQNMIRPLVQKYVPGTVAISPFGPNVRSILVNVNPDKLRTYNLSPQDVVDSIMKGNVVIPAGNLYIQDRMPLVPTNALVTNIQDLGKIPLKLGSNVYIRDVAVIEDATDVNYGHALVNGIKSVYLPIVKKDTASTLTVVADIHKAMEYFKQAVPEDVEMSFEFDESPAVVTAIRSVATEGLIGAGLTGLMIMIFLRDIRSVIVVVCNIPLALLGSLFGLYATGNTINIMSLGGLALAIGILVDEATVEIENIHAQMRKTPSLARAVRRGNDITAVARLLALFCILSVFIPAFIMQDPLRSLFMPLSLAVGFAMISSYLLSSTFVPVMAVWLLKAHGHHVEEKKTFFDKVEGLFERLSGWTVKLRWAVVSVYLAATGATLFFVGSQLGTELFPQIDSGQFVLRFRPPAGTNFEITRMMAQKTLEIIQREAGEKKVAISIGFAGQVAPNFGMNNMVLFMRGPDDGMLRVALRKGSGIELDAFREKLRKVLPQEIAPWLAEVMQQNGVPAADAKIRCKEISFGFEPGDMVSKVMTFGSATPIEIVVFGTNLVDVRTHATKLKGLMAQVPCLRDVQFHQSLDYPTVEVNIDREKAGLSGVNVQQVGNSVIVATSSSRFIALNYWQDPRTGFDYQVEVLVPTQRMTSPLQVETLPLIDVNNLVNLMVRDVAQVKTGVMPGQIDRLSSQRYLSITANLEHTDLGRASRLVEKAIVDAGQPPRGVHLEVRGQLDPMTKMFKSLAIGLAVAVFVILVMLTAYFQMPRLAITSIAAVPGVLSGVVVTLYFTHTSLNIESFMGSIMCIGVSVSNSVMLVTFMTDRWLEGLPVREAAVKGAAGRLRPILMTACAMTVGMLPMALALEEGSEMQAPLGRAVIGGLVCSTFATLLVLPAVFSLLLGERKPHPISIDPDDPQGKYYDHEGREDLHSGPGSATSPAHGPTG